MRFKDYVWPHNPRVYEIDFKRNVIAHKVPFGHYVLQSLGRSNRVLRGEGEFCGDDAYDEFKKLATVFYDNTPGALVHPIWQNAQAFFVSLSLRQEPRADYVRYAFEFWECFDEYETKIVPQSGSATEISAPASQEQWYTVVRGDTLWAIANRHGLSLPELLGINPQIKNPNLLYPGDQVRVK